MISKKVNLQWVIMKTLELTFSLYKILCSNPVLGMRKLTRRGYFSLRPSIKSRVERDCLPVSQNKTENLNNTCSKKPVYQVPKVLITSYVMRVLKETGIERGGRPENKGRPINVMIELSKMTLFQKLNNQSTAFALSSAKIVI